MRTEFDIGTRPNSLLDYFIYNCIILLSLFYAKKSSVDIIYTRLPINNIIILIIC